MARYVIRDGELVDRVSGEKMPVRRGELCTPMVLSDIHEYLSPIDGRVIGSRSERRDDLKRNNCVEYEPSLSPTKGKFRNAKFAKKFGVEVSEEFRT